MRKILLCLLCLFIVSLCFSQDTDSPSASLPDQMSTKTKNYPPHPWNDIIGSSDLDITRTNTGESLMSNLVCDAMLTRTEADFAFISYGELYSNLYQGNITRLDMFRLFPFDRTLVVLEMSGDTLKKIIEKHISSVQHGLAIAGGKVEYNPKRPTQNRLTYCQISEYPLYPKKEYRVVTIDYLANGFAGFDLLKDIDPARVFRTGTLLRDTISEYIRQKSPLDQTKVKLDGRWIKK